MPGPKIVDTLPTFLQYWQDARHHPLEVQVDLWLAHYAPQWPVLADKQQQAYAEDGLDWRTVLKDRVFPFLPERVPLMEQARHRLLACIPAVYGKARDVVGLDFDVVFVILAIGWGGWATQYQGERACLLGLDTIVELGWTEKETMSGLVAHELGHLLQLEWRARRDLPSGEGPFWDMYQEGFAQRCEHLILGDDTWHMTAGQPTWLPWCQNHQSWLASEFLKTAARGDPVYNFFGSWAEFNICGYHDCGRFLGHEMLRRWEKDTEFRDMALLTPAQVDDRLRQALEEMASSPPEAASP